MTTLLWVLTGASNAWFCWLIVGYLRKAPRYLANADQMVAWMAACAGKGLATPRGVRSARRTRAIVGAFVAFEVLSLGVCGAGVLYSAWCLLGGAP